MTKRSAGARAICFGDFAPVAVSGDAAPFAQRRGVASVSPLP
ncbi:hypothetical protein [Tateyamaria sp.]